MSDIDLDELKIRAERLTDLGGDTQDLALDALNLIERVRKAEVERDEYRRQFPCDGGCDYIEGPVEECTLHGRSVRELWEIAGTQIERAERAEATIAEVMSARSNHPECDRHGESDPVTCGWLRAVQDIDAALSRYENGTNPETGRTE